MNQRQLRRKIRKIIKKLAKHKIEYEKLKGDYSFSKSLIDKQKSEIINLILEVEKPVNKLILEARNSPPSDKVIDQSISRETKLVWPYYLEKERLKTFKSNYPYYQQKFLRDDLNLNALINMYKEINGNLWIQSNEWIAEDFKKSKSCKDSREKVKNDMLYLLDALTLVIGNTIDLECAPSSYTLGVTAIYDKADQ